MNTFYEHRCRSPLLVRQLGAASGPPWWGPAVAPAAARHQVGSIFNEAVRDSTAKRCNGVSTRRTTQSDATNHRRCRTTGISLDAAGCTGEPLPGIFVHFALLHGLRKAFRGHPGGPGGESSR